MFGVLSQNLRTAARSLTARAPFFHVSCPKLASAALSSPSSGEHSDPAEVPAQLSLSSAETLLRKSCCLPGTGVHLIIRLKSSTPQRALSRNDHQEETRFIPQHTGKSCAGRSLQSSGRNHCAPSLLPSRNAPGTEGGIWGGLGAQETIIDHTAPGSGLLAPSGVLRQGHYPQMAVLGQPFVKWAGSLSPVLSTEKLSLLIGPLLVKAGE